MIASLLWTAVTFFPPLWVLAAIFLPMTLILTLCLIQPVKGATIALMLHVGLKRPDVEV